MSGFRVEDFRVKPVRCRFKGLGFGVWDLRFRVLGLGFRG
jgi:hypothetical protein